MIILQANKIERSFAGEVLFDNINLQVDERDRIALVGKNGAGKSTLLKILVGEEEPTSGEILLNGKDINSYGIDKKRPSICYFSRHSPLAIFY